MPAHDIGDQVRKIVLGPRIKHNKWTNAIDHAFACSIIERIEVRPQHLVVKFRPNPVSAYTANWVVGDVGLEPTTR